MLDFLLEWLSDFYFFFLGDWLYARHRALWVVVELACGAALLALTVLSFRSGVAAVGVLLAVVWAAWAFHFFVTLLHRRPKPQKRGWNSAFGKHI